MAQTKLPSESASKKPAQKPTKARTSATASEPVKTTSQEVVKAGPKRLRAKSEAVKKTPTPKPPITAKLAAKPPRSRLERQGKKYRQAHKLLDQTRDYDLKEAIEILPKASFVKFDPSVEIHINLGVDPKQADQMVRGVLSLPHGSGQTQRVAVLAAADKQDEAKKGGADLVGHEELLEDIKKGNFDFDILVTTPDMMRELAQHAKELGPKGLMPNPKSGTVTSNLSKTIKELKAGRIEFRMDSAGIIHQVVGKLSFKPEQLLDNTKNFLKAVQQARPAALKGTYIQKITLTTSMGPGLKLNVPKAITGL